MAYGSIRRGHCLEDLAFDTLKVAYVVRTLVGQGLASPRGPETNVAVPYITSLVTPAKLA